MKSIEKIKNDLKDMIIFEAEGETIENRVIEEFEDRQEFGESEVIVDDTNTTTNIEGYGLCEEWTVYINHKDSENINFAVKRNTEDNTVRIVAVF